MSPLYRPTPWLTPHARERCREMGISTKVAKAIVRDPAVVRPGNPGSGCLVATSDRHPDYGVVYAPGAIPKIVTVIFHTHEFFARNGTGFLTDPGRDT